MHAELICEGSVAVEVYGAELNDGRAGSREKDVGQAGSVHSDDHNNFGITSLVCIDLDGDLVGGSHVMYNLDLAAAIVVQTNTEGVWLLGDYRRVLHANGATHRGRRFVVTAYCSDALVKFVRTREV